MKLMLLLAFAFNFSSFTDKPFEGVWKGTITRDFGDEITTDSIQFVLQQTDDKVKGYSLIFTKAGKYIRSEVVGIYYADTRMLKLTEVNMQATNILLDESDFFLDRYLLSVEALDSPALYGKSIPCEKRLIYTRSKIYIRKV